MRWRARVAVPTLWAGLMLTTPGAFAQDAPEDPPAVVTAANAPVVYRHLERRIRIESDGRYTEAAVVRVTVQHQAVVQAWGQLVFNYQGEHDTLALRKLVVEKRDGSRIEVDVSHLEDAPTPQSGSFDAPSYNDTRARQITVPNLAVGDTVAYETETIRHAPFLAGHFWDEHTFQDDVVSESEVFTIDYPTSLAVAVKVRGGLEANERREEAGGRLRRSWTRRVQEVREPPRAEMIERFIRAVRGRLNPPDVQVSTFKTWDSVASWYAGLAGPAEMPDSALRARARALAGGDAGGQLGRLHTLVAQNVRYVSLAFGDGRYRPRPAGLTLSSAYGDCKDKHALLASMGRELSFDIRPVLINSMRDLDEDFPSPGQFNHVISFVRDAEGREIWVDATNDVARPGELAKSLRGKQGLLVRGNGTGMVLQTPADLHVPETVDFDVDGEFRADGTYAVTVRRQATGDAEMLLRSALTGVGENDRLEMAKRLAIEDGLSKDLTVRDVAIIDPHDLSGPVWVRYRAERTYNSPVQAEASAFWVPAPKVVPDVPDDAKTIALGRPSQVSVRAKFVLPDTLSVSAPIGVSLSSEVATYESSYAADRGTLMVTRRVVTRVDELSAEQLAAYRSVAKGAAADRQQQFAIAAASSEALAAVRAYGELADRGKRALDRRDWLQAIDLLQQAVKADAGHRQAWTWLGSALLGAGRSKEAIDAYNRQVAIDPFSEYAYRNRALAEWGAGQLTEAEASLRKQLDVTPLNRQALTNLGSLLIERKRPSEAIEPLTKAVSLDGKDAWSQLALGRAYAGAGKSAEALSAFERTVMIAPNPLMWNNAAWYMAEHDLAFDRAFEYAQSATTAAAASTLLLSLDKSAGPQLSLTSSLAAYWDTLGWVEFKRGNVESALRYLRASWQVREEAIVGEHLGRVLERLKRPREAFVVYRTALGLPAPSDWLRDRTRELGLSLKPAPTTTDSGTLLTQKRTVAVSKSVVPVRIVEVMLVANAKGLITSARAVAATETSAAAARSLVGTRLPVDAPDAVPFRLVVRGALSCADGKPPCSLVLFGLNDALQRSSSDARVE